MYSMYISFKYGTKCAYGTQQNYCYNIMQQCSECQISYIPLTHKYVFLVDRELLIYKLCEFLQF